MDDRRTNLHGAPERGRLVVATLVGLALTALVAAVALTGRSGDVAAPGPSEPPSEQVLDYLVSIVLALLALGTVFLAYTLWTQRIALADNRYRRGRSSVRSIAIFAAAIAVLALIAKGVDIRFLDRERDPDVPAAHLDDRADNPAANRPRREPGRREFELLPALVVVLLGGAGFAALLLGESRARRRQPPQSAAEALSAVLDETLDDLRSQPDARLAVIAAYARMERTLAASGLPRSPAEAPLEYLARVLGELEVSAEAAARLTNLFEWAKFSRHEVRPAMREAAIAALESVQAELRERR